MNGGGPNYPDPDAHWRGIENRRANMVKDYKNKGFSNDEAIRKMEQDEKQRYAREDEIIKQQEHLFKDKPTGI